MHIAWKLQVPAVILQPRVNTTAKIRLTVLFLMLYIPFSSAN